ncbi:MAG: tetratricopeptide repeat protein [Magnetococcus sp. DMHC-1]|nr:tetratricopeptide repeat protein [Magnetococcales bacterium]
MANSNHLSANLADMFQEGLAHHQQGDLVSAMRCYESVLAQHEQVDVLYALALARLALKEYAIALDAMKKVMVQRTPDGSIYDTLGKIYWGMGRLEDARQAFEQSVTLGHAQKADSMCHLGWVLLLLKRHEEAAKLLFQVIELQPDLATAYQGLALIHEHKGLPLLQSIHQQLFQYYAARPVAARSVENVFILDPEAARQTARLGQRRPLNKHYSVPQLCYTLGESRPDDPPNLIPLLPNKIIEYFTTTRLSYPVRMVFDPGKQGVFDAAVQIATLIESARKQRARSIADCLQRCRNLAPDYDGKTPLRIAMITSRYTSVMQHATTNLAKALRELGCLVQVDIEQNDLEVWDDPLTTLMNHEAFKPHVTININHRFNDWLHPDIINITWWQDLMPEIRNSTRLNWRPRDLVFSAYPDFDDYLLKTGAPQVLRQDLCVDLSVFRTVTPWEERRKVVFIGSTYTEVLELDAAKIQYIENVLQPGVERGEYVSLDFLENLSRKMGISTFGVDFVYSNLVRNTAVEWLCQIAGEIDLEVEVYGRFWEKNAIVQPFFKGELPHGAAVAEVYNQARYALAAHPHMVKSQRLAEIAACGCVPVLNDDRAHAEPPHWDDAILFFKTRTDLKNCLSQRPSRDPWVIAEASTYALFARRILDCVSSILKQPITGNVS